MEEFMPEIARRRQFASDNYAGICPEAWAAMDAANRGYATSYGDDHWTAKACECLRELFETDCEVFFVFNGTAANSLALASLCHSYHSIICHEMSHVETDECGASEFFSREVIPFGISMIAAVLQRAGHEVRLLVFTPETPIRTLLEETFRDFHPRMVCITGVSTQVPVISRVAEELKRLDPSLFVVLGGHHAILNAEEAIEFPWLDAICVGEGEAAVGGMRIVSCSRNASAMRWKTSAQSPARSCRKSRMVGYQGESVRSSIQRQSAW